jgi:peptidoglycan hydrolase-like protein with peptidoglycan-binding domain
MTPTSTRLFVLVFIGVATAISVNALYLQDARFAASGAHMVAAQSDTGSRTSTAALPQPETRDTPPPTPARQETKPRTPNVGALPAPEQLVWAISRELRRNGYEAGPYTGEAGVELRGAILAYEFDQQLPMTGEPTEAILKALLFGATGQAAGGSEERFESRRRLVAEVQQMLAGLGYGGGSADGRLDETTREAIRKFENDRNLDQGGRLTPRVLLEMVVVSGRPFAVNG